MVVGVETSGKTEADKARPGIEGWDVLHYKRLHNGIHVEP